MRRLSTKDRDILFGVGEEQRGGRRAGKGPITRGIATEHRSARRSWLANAGTAGGQSTLVGNVTLGQALTVIAQ